MAVFPAQPQQLWMAAFPTGTQPPAPPPLAPDGRLPRRTPTTPTPTTTAPDGSVSRRTSTASQKICQIECQKIWQKACQKRCQKECQKYAGNSVRKNVCQRICQKECQNKVSVHARKFVGLKCHVGDHSKKSIFYCTIPSAPGYSIRRHLEPETSLSLFCVQTLSQGTMEFHAPRFSLRCLMCIHVRRHFCSSASHLSLQHTLATQTSAANRARLNSAQSLWDKLLISLVWLHACTT